MNQTGKIDLMVKITKKSEDMLYHYFQYAKRTNTIDRGIETWFRIEIVSEMEKDGKKIQYFGKKADFQFLGDNFRTELKATSSFHPGWIIDGMIQHHAPVLFFSGFLKRLKEENPKYERKEEVMKRFVEYVQKNRLNEIKKAYGKTGINLIYQTVNLKNEKCMVGLVNSSSNYRCAKI